MTSPPGSVSQLIIDGFSIVLIDLLLAGDNAVIIAMAVRALPERQRRIAVACGAGAAVILRIAITILAAVQLLNVEFLKLAGGALVIWIAVKVLSEARSHVDKIPARGRLLQAIWLIVVADITMSIDNVLAVAGAAHGSVPLIIFGLGVSIPLVVFSSQLIARLMDRYAAIVYLGAALLGRVGGEMIMTDPFVTRTWRPSQSAVWLVEIVAIGCIFLVGKFVAKLLKIPVTKPGSRSIVVSVRAPSQTSEGPEVEEGPLSFEGIFDLHYSRIARAIARITGDPSRSEELAMEVFWKFWQTPQAHGDKAGGWLYRTAINLGLGELRRRARHARYERLLRLTGPSTLGDSRDPGRNSRGGGGTGAGQAGAGEHQAARGGVAVASQQRFQL